MEAVEPRSCLNCEAAMTGPYCSSCGQKQPHTDLTLRELLHETTHELVHWEGHAALFGVLAVSTVAGAFSTSEAHAIVVGLAGLTYVVWYGLFALRRLFGDSWVKTTAKAAAIAAGYSVCLFVMSLSMLAYALMRM